MQRDMKGVRGPGNDLGGGYLGSYVGPIYPAVRLRYLHFTACMLYPINLKFLCDSENNVFH